MLSPRHVDSEISTSRRRSRNQGDPGRTGETMKPLFDKTLDELREAFVRARFAEPNIFGRPDIEEWLEGQRKAYYPDWSRTGFARFGVLIARYAGHPLTGEHLNKYATP